MESTNFINPAQALSSALAALSHIINHYVFYWYYYNPIIKTIGENCLVTVWVKVDSMFCEIKSHMFTHGWQSYLCMLLLLSHCPPPFEYI